MAQIKLYFESGTGLITLFDALGNIISNYPIEVSNDTFKKRINIESLQKGIYFLRINVGDKDYSKKFIKL
jgi:hypothetical protein